MNLQLSLKNKWFEMTKTGTKTEDYREITPYWLSRLMYYSSGSGLSLTKEELEEACSDIRSANQSIYDFTEHLDYHLDNWYLKFKPFKINRMTLGYPKSDDKEKNIDLEHKGIEIRTGKPEWGAKPDKLYFVILHGSIIE